jgi:hypothetical protein
VLSAPGARVTRVYTRYNLRGQPSHWCTSASCATTQHGQHTHTTYSKK